MFLVYLQLLLPRQRKDHTIVSVLNVLIKKMYWGLVLQLPHTSALFMLLLCSLPLLTTFLFSIGWSCQCLVMKILFFVHHKYISSEALVWYQYSTMLSLCQGLWQSETLIYILDLQTTYFCFHDRVILVHLWCYIYLTSCLRDRLRIVEVYYLKMKLEDKLKKYTKGLNSNFQCVIRYAPDRSKVKCRYSCSSLVWPQRK